MFFLLLRIDHLSHSIIITKRWGAAFCWWTPLAGDYVKNLRFARICWYGHLGNLDVSLQGLEKGARVKDSLPYLQNCPKHQTSPWGWKSNCSWLCFWIDWQIYGQCGKIWDWGINETMIMVKPILNDTLAMPKAIFWLRWPTTPP